MAKWLEDEVESYIGAIVAVFKALGKNVDVRKAFWASYPIRNYEGSQLEELVTKDTKKLEREIDDSLCKSNLWYIGVPRFRLIHRGIPHLRCEIDLYYAAGDTCDGRYAYWWFGRIMTKADAFDVPICLISPLLEALQKGDTDTKEAHIVERGDGYTLYDFRGREWKIPDAFLGFVMALKDKAEDFAGLLDPITCLWVDRLAEELSAPEIPELMRSDDYERIVTCLEEQMGYPKAKAEEATEYVIGKFSNESLETRIAEALKYLGTE